MAWVPLTAFNHVYNENCKQKAEQKDLRNLNLRQKKRTGDVEAKGGAVAEEISSFKKKPSTLNEDL